MTELRKLTLDQPIQQMLERVALDPALFGLKFQQEYQFVQGADGIEIHDAEGNVPIVTGEDGKPREAAFTEADIKALCSASPAKESYDMLLVGSRASGGGAIGAKSARVTVPGDKPAPRPAPVHFGLA